MADSFHIPWLAHDESGRAACRLAGRLPDFVARPGSEEECAEVARWAASERVALVPWGGGSAVQKGNPLRADRWAVVRTSGLSGIAEFSPDDMVVTAGSGTPLAELQASLAESRQFLPLDPPEPGIATLGGIVATNAHGLWRPAFGIPRDRLLGIRVAMADGKVIRGGGKVVKNVAGYDLCKLFAGSWGTLGIITEVTFKTNPLPEARVHRTFIAPSLAAAAEAALAVHIARLDPTYLILSLLGGPALSFGLMGGAEACAWQEQEIARRLEECGLVCKDIGPTEDSLRHAHAGSPIAARLTVRPTEVPRLMVDLERPGPTIPARVTAAAQLGVIDVSWREESLDIGRAIVDSLRNALPPEGHLSWQQVPEAWRISDVWGPTRGDFGLMRRIKDTLDPDGLFSPGRFIGRL